MAKLNLAQLQMLAYTTGFPDPSLAAAVAMAESGGDPEVLGDLQLGVSVGLWQVNLKAHPQYEESWLKNPTNNAEAALAISQGGTNWHPWTTFNTGAYKAFVKPFTPPTKRNLAIAVGVGVAILGIGGAVAWAIYTDRIPFLGGGGAAGAAEAPKRRKAMRVQSLLIPRSWGVEKAKAWAESHGYKHGKVDETERYIRLRQLPPESFKVKRTITLGKGVRAVVAR